MSTRSYTEPTEAELEAYFSNPNARKRRPDGHGVPPSGRRNGRGLHGYFLRRFGDARKATAAAALTVITGALLAVTLLLGLYMAILATDLPPLSKLENPDFQLATVAYTADNEVLARYARQNRSWATYDEISPHVINALIATEDHRFYDHWGMDLFRTASAVVQTVLAKLHVPGFYTQGGSTITQQLARNLYNDQIGFEQTIGRKLKEWVTAVQLERRYTKREILEMYLNTVEFGYNAWGIETAARTFYNTSAAELDPLQSATLIGMLKAITRFNPVRNPENAQARRNLVLRKMVEHGYLTQAYYEEHKDDPPGASYHSAEITASMAPHFAIHVRDWLRDWAEPLGLDIYEDGLVVYTTIDSRLQRIAQQAVARQMKGLQAVVDYHWSRPSSGNYSTDINDFLKLDGYEPFGYFWQTHAGLLNTFIQETARFRSLRNQGLSRDAALDSLKRDAVFLDSLKTNKTRLEAGLVALDPNTGSVKAWVGGKNYEEDKYDHVALARRQPGSTFKPFVYTVAIDNGYSPYYTLRDTTFTYVDPTTGQVWSPGNTDGISGATMTLRDGLAQSKNTITGQLALEVGARNIALYARRMGIQSPLDEVPALSLGTSDVTLLELTSAYCTLANGGLYYPPTFVTRVEDRYGNVLYEATPTPKEALSETTAYTMVDMMRQVILTGTGQRIRWQWGLGGYDLAGKTGTTQNSADGWFMLMHPDLVTGAWVGFNDRRITFRTNWWGQGAHNALYLVGDFFKSATDSAGIGISRDARFPTPADFAPAELPGNDDKDDGRVGW